ncbi:MAG TPA: hypothetical protein VHZ24_13870 [Pirellulales bacterium]|nr:hypothetical protein [Pirellulales bacterium]
MTPTSNRRRRTSSLGQAANGQDGEQRAGGITDRSRQPHRTDEDGRAHLAYKAEHVVDLKSELVLAAEIRHADEGDTPAKQMTIGDVAKSRIVGVPGGEIRWSHWVCTFTTDFAVKACDKDGPRQSQVDASFCARDDRDEYVEVAGRCAGREGGVLPQEPRHTRHTLEQAELDRR